jgi:hypothetical protein
MDMGSLVQTMFIIVLCLLQMNCRVSLTMNLNLDDRAREVGKAQAQVVEAPPKVEDGDVDGEVVPDGAAMEVPKILQDREVQIPPRARAVILR